MEFRQENASVTVTQSDGAWVVKVTENGRDDERAFADGDAAEQFAHAQRLRLGIVPQQDMS
jgi:hypothetical protein